MHSSGEVSRARKPMHTDRTTRVAIPCFLSQEEKNSRQRKLRRAMLSRSNSRRRKFRDSSGKLISILFPSSASFAAPCSISLKSISPNRDLVSSSRTRLGAGSYLAPLTRERYDCLEISSDEFMIRFLEQGYSRGSSDRGIAGV